MNKKERWIGTQVQDDERGWSHYPERLCNVYCKDRKLVQLIIGFGINKLLKQFEQISKMVKKVSKMNPKDMAAMFRNFS